MARDYAKFSPRFWTGDTGRKIRGNRDAQVLAAYLISAPGSTMTGIYYLPLPIVAHETGIAADVVVATLAFLATIDFAHYDEIAELVWIPGMAAWQIDDELHANDKRVKGVRRELAALGRHPFVAKFWDRYSKAFHLGEKVLDTKPEGASKGLRSQEHEQEQDHEQEQEQDKACSEPPTAPSEPALMVFPCVGKGPKEFSLTRAMVLAWSDAWPGIDVLAECKKARAWVTANPAKRKTNGGMQSFLTRWCNRAQDVGGNSARAGPQAGKPNTRDSVARVLARHGEST